MWIHRPFSPQTLPSRGGSFGWRVDLYAARLGPGTEYPRALRALPIRSEGGRAGLGRPVSF